MKTYFGSQCGKCGGTERYKSSSNCVTCAKRKATERYEKKIGGEPPRRSSRLLMQAAKEAGQKTFMGKPCKRGHSGERYTRQGGCVECDRQRWYIYPAVKIRMRIMRQKPQNRNKANQYGKKWREENFDKDYDYRAQKRARKRIATPSWSNPKARMFFYRMAKLLSKQTGVLHHVDHIVPLKSKYVCGLHCEDNLQVIPATENMQKHNSWWPDMS